MSKRGYLVLPFLLLSPPQADGADLWTAPGQRPYLEERNASERVETPLLALQPGTAEIVRTERPPRIVIVGDPTIAEATVTTERTVLVVAKGLGTTNLILLDEAGQEFDRRMVRVGRRTVLLYNGDGGFAGNEEGGGGSSRTERGAGGSLGSAREGGAPGSPSAQASTARAPGSITSFLCEPFCTPVPEPQRSPVTYLVNGGAPGAVVAPAAAASAPVGIP